MTLRLSLSTFISGIVALLLCFSAHAQVLTQTKQDLGNGFYLQESKQINVAGRWHSDKTFKFLYFGKRHVCQCSNISISPNGKFALFQDATNLNIASFNPNKNSVTVLSKLPAGKLHEVTWDKKDDRKVEVSVDIQQNKGADGHSAPEIKKTRLRLK
ncbi:hypothetical protein H8K35_15905 [Undibacterium sp. LX40W]|uniref:Uncharacterized protein n=1 Tax=Undibacterium nitidum TaxID=2762298 RepID=A0A923HWW1_9BURK|nr:MULTISPECIES: hypothetical protein [Undibacterium]MBC3882879.1 hypothetical protein [Undibacterium nitidum]MBC3893160.1 hypothetical protein [Undibacterium sp. LX40W]